MSAQHFEGGPGKPFRRVTPAPPRKRNPPTTTKPKRVKLTRDERDAQRKREGELVAELCGAHGYAMIDRKLKDRFALTFNAKAGQVTTQRLVTLAMPIDSALAIELDKFARAKDKHDAKLGGAATRSGPKRHKESP